MRAKIFYMNDEDKTITVKVMDKTFDTTTGQGESYTILQSAEGRMFELDIPEDSILWVKKWPGMVLISYVYSSALVQPDVRPLLRGGL